MNDVYTFTSAVEMPNGVTVTVTISASESIYGPDVRELSEVSQMAVIRACSIVDRNVKPITYDEPLKPWEIELLGGVDGAES